MMKPNRRIKFTLAGILIILVLLSTPWTNHQVHRSFFIRSPISAGLPTTSRAQEINLKQFKNEDFEAKDLRSQLASQFPYRPEVKIPRRIWQTWIYGLNDERVPAAFKHYATKWKDYAVEDFNRYEHHLVTDDEIPALLEQLYGGVPHVLQAFHSLPRGVMKADFFRYLILYARGGIYSDIDTYPLKSLNTWPSTNNTVLSEYTKKRVKYGANSDHIDDDDDDDDDTNDGMNNGANDDALKLSKKAKKAKVDPGFVIGIEADPDRSDWAQYYARRIQFCQWTIQSKPGHPILRELIVNITGTTLHSMAKLAPVNSNLPPMRIDETHEKDYNVNYRHNRYHDESYQHTAKKTPANTDETDIMNWTGPGIFSDIVFEYLNNLLQRNENIKIYNNNLIGSHEAEDYSEDHQDNDLFKTTLRFNKLISSSLLASNPKLHWGFFSLMHSPAVVDDVLVLPITSFSPGVGHMGSEEDHHPAALVKHIFEGSWKKDYKPKKETTEPTPPEED